MTDITKNPHPNTIAFHCLEPQVAALILDVIDSIVSILRWRQCSRILLSAIISRIAETGEFECSHAEFSFALWPDKKEPSREDKFGKWLAKFKEDMDLSNCKPVDIPKPRIDRRADGQFRSKPTLYLIGNFWKIFRAVQDAALQCNLLSMEKKPRRLRVRAIVNKYLREIGAIKIIRERKEKGEREREAGKSASLLCKCNCASCVQCASKGATASEAGGASAARIRKLARQPNEVFHTWLEGVTEEFYQWLCETGEIDSQFRFRVKSQIQAFEVEVNRAREMIVRNNKAGLKLVGGQPK